MNALAGYRTYISALGIIVAAVVAWAVGDIPLVDAVTQILVGTGIAGLRAAK